MSIQILAYVTALATLVYGLATLCLWYENRQDRLQRQKQFDKGLADRKLYDLHSAFYEAWGFWNGHTYSSEDTKGDQASNIRLFEALIRLECQLRLNNYNREANNLGFAIRTLNRIDEGLSEVGLALELLPSEYCPTVQPRPSTTNPATKQPVQP